MIEYIKLKKHKGIAEIKLTALGRVNVICGKNNGGKTSTLEAMTQKEKYSFGVIVDEKAFSILLPEFQAICQRYSSPSPKMSMQWFEKFLEEMRGKILYEDEIDSLNESLKKRWSKDSNHGQDTFNFKAVFTKLFQKQNLYNPFLVPPKRELSMKSPISNFQSGDLPTSINILKRLFVLQNANNRSEERRLYDHINAVFESITDGFRFHIELDAQNGVSIHFTNVTVGWLPGEDCGLGLRDILVILHYVLDSSYNTLLIEEPESHIHPDMQRRLLKFISTISSKQFIFTTHSNIFLDPSYVSKIIYVEYGSAGIVATDETNKANMLSNLGYSIIDNLVSDLLVLTEGPTDIPVIKQLCDKLDFLHKYNLKFAPLGGDIMHYVDLAVFGQHSNVIAIVDADPKSAKIRKIFIEKCNAANIPCTKLKRYAIENYFTLAAIKKIYPHPNVPIPDTVTQIAPNESVEKQLGFSVKAKGREIVEVMTIDDFKGTDLLAFCQSIETKLKEAVG